jgi:hypothetical protein
VPERWDAFSRGLEKLGYSVVQGVTARPGDRDILVTWNRINDGNTAARAFEARGLPVLVTENATWGNDFAGNRWYTLARGFHNLDGRFPVGGPERWDSLGVEPAAWRTRGELVILPQRGIGPPGVAMPSTWPESALKRHGGRLRPHPGKRESKPLADDLARCERVVTWGSGAAVQALLMGIRVTSEMPEWIAEQDNTDAGRLATFRRMAWAQWRLAEIASGEPFERLLA